MAESQEREPGSLIRAMRMARRALAGAADWTADLIVPPVCLACRKPLAVHDALCAACWRDVKFIRPPLCDRLGVPLPYDTGAPVVSAQALADPPVYDRARTVAHFDGVVRKLIHQMKYGDRHDARRLFARWLKDAGSELLKDCDLIVPVPLNRWRLLRRRFNQAAILARELERLTGIRCDPLVLARPRRTPSQVGLTQDQRRRNVAGAFAVPPGRAREIEGRRVLLVDDVITTGATVAACARALKKAGAARVDALAVALVTDEAQIDP
jgi:ComF family protein